MYEFEREKAVKLLLFIFLLYFIMFFWLYTDAPLLQQEKSEFRQLIMWEIY